MIRRYLTMMTSVKRCVRLEERENMEMMTYRRDAIGWSEMILIISRAVRIRRIGRIRAIHPRAFASLLLLCSRLSM
jgi:hypothetical protein